MTDKPISRFPVPDLQDVPEDLREQMLAVQEKTGFIPNVFLALAHRPDELRAFFAYHDALMERESGLSKADKEMIVVATSAENDCQYCVVAHGAILRIRAKNPLIADQVAIDLEIGNRYFPTYSPMPEGKTADEYLREICIAGLKDRYEGNDG